MSVFGDVAKVGIVALENRLKIGTRPGQYPELQLEVEASETLAKGDLVYISNYDATTKRPTVSIADANAVGKIATFVMLKDTSAAAKGRAVAMGLVTGTASQTLVTNGFSVGDLVYLTATGTTTNTWDTIPSGIDDVVMAVGVVIVSSATVGQIYFFPGMSVPQTYGNIAIANLSITRAKIALDAIDGTRIEDNAVDTEHVVADLIQVVDVQFGNTAVLDLATPAELVPAPAANKVIIVHKVLLVCDSTSGAFSESDAPDELQVQYADGVVITAELDSTGFVTAGNIQVRTMGAAEAVAVPDVAAAVVLHNTGANFGGGNAANTLSVRVWFSEADAIAF